MRKAKNCWRCQGQYDDQCNPFHDRTSASLPGDKGNDQCCSVFQGFEGNVEDGPGHGSLNHTSGLTLAAMTTIELESLLPQEQLGLTPKKDPNRSKNC